MFKTPLLALTLLAPTNCAVELGGDCRHEEPRQASLDTQGLSEIVIRAEAGRLRVTGSSAASAIEVDGLACSSRRSDLDDIHLVAERDGSRAIIESRIETRGRYRNARLDLDITVPDDLPLIIEDTSGDIELIDVAGVEIEDRSGDITVEGVSGDLRLHDSSGDVTLIDVSGAIRLDDGSGDVHIRNAASVTVDDDGSGDLEIEHIAGDVEIKDDGSGDIEVFDVGGDLTVRDSGSGDVDYDDIDGVVDVR